MKKKIEEEKRFGVDHYDEDINKHGISYCLLAYNEYRAQKEPKINSCFTPFSEQYNLEKKIRAVGDLYEIR